jgi:hypothetical protein
MADGFGRVNLIVGKNDCGKTSFMEALQLADEAENAAHLLLFDQRDRLGRTTQSHDFERFWRPMFFGLDAKVGFAISVERDDGTRKTVEVRQGVPSEAFILPDHDDEVCIGYDDTRTDLEVIKAPTWALDVQRIGYDRVQAHQQIVATPTRLKLPRILRRFGAAWITSTTVGEKEIKYVSTLMQRGQDRALVELLRAVDGRVSGIQLLAPSGEIVELFVRLDHEAPLLPMALMGEGVQRCLDIGVALAAHDWPIVYIDNIERSLHHLVLEPLWRWIATISRQRGLQVFASTHSDECIHAAARAFQSLDDDGLRVIRLDRRESETRATIYDRALVETAKRTGTEIRG